MNRDRFMRRALWATAVFNLGGAYLFAFPASTLGQLAGFPPEVSLVYRTLMALFVLLFGGAYAWLASQPAIDRPLVVLAALGKSGVFAVFLVLWLCSVASGRSVLVVSGDLVFAAIFVGWLVSTQKVT